MKDLIDKQIKKYINGDPKAFREIYDLTKKPVFLSIHAFIKDKMKIEDLMQETYMKAINSLSTYKLGTNFKAWICTIARNKTLDYLREKKEVLYNVTDFSELLKEDFPSDLLFQIRKLLTEKEYCIFIYHALLDYTYNDIGMMLNLKLKEVAYIYKKTCEKLQKNI